MVAGAAPARLRARPSTTARSARREPSSAWTTYSPSWALAQGAKVTLTLFFITLALAVPLGLALALARISRWRALSQLVNGYIWLMRGTPLMLQMLFIYFALPFVPVIGVRLPDFPAAVVAFGLNYAAYFAEIFRAGIQSVDRGQYEGSKVLGMSYLQTMRRIVLPQMVQRVLPPMSNETITLVKDTSPDLRAGPERHPAHGAGHCAAGLHHHALPGGRRLLPDHDAGVDVVLPASGKAPCQVRPVIPWIVPS